MEAVLISKQEFNEMHNFLKEIKEGIKEITSPAEQFIDNREFVKLMKISLRTAQTWRDEGKIGFSQEGKKIYYRMSDIERFLKDRHQKPFGALRQAM